MLGNCEVGYYKLIQCLSCISLFRSQFPLGRKYPFIVVTGSVDFFGERQSPTFSPRLRRLLCYMAVFVVDRQYWSGLPFSTCQRSFEATDTSVSSAHTSGHNICNLSLVSCCSLTEALPIGFTEFTELTVCYFSCSQKSMHFFSVSCVTVLAEQNWPGNRNCFSIYQGQGRTKWHTCSG